MLQSFKIVSIFIFHCIKKISLKILPIKFTLIILNCTCIFILESSFFLKILNKICIHLKKAFEIFIMSSKDHDETFIIHYCINCSASEV